MLAQSKSNTAQMTSNRMKNHRTVERHVIISIISWNYNGVCVPHRDRFLWLHSVFALVYFIITLLCMAHHSMRLEYREDEKVCHQGLATFPLQKSSSSQVNFCSYFIQISVTAVRLFRLASCRNQHFHTVLETSVSVLIEDKKQNQEKNASIFL